MPVALVTGASRGIGLATCRRLAARGWKTLALARSAETLEELSTKIPGLIPVPLDLSETDGLDRRLDPLLDEHGPVEALINNAGYGLRGGGGRPPPPRGAPAIRSQFIQLFALDPKSPAGHAEGAQGHNRQCQLCCRLDLQSLRRHLFGLQVCFGGG